MTFGEIQTRVADYLNRNDLTSQIQDFIKLAQKKIARKYNLKYMKNYTSGTLTSGSAYLTIPTLYKEIVSLFVTSSSRFYQINKEEHPYSLSIYPYLTDQKGLPKIVSTDEPNSRFVFRPTPDSNYAYDLWYYKYSTELSSSSDTNWLTNNAWEVLIYMSLVEAEPFLVNDSRIKTWIGMAEFTMDELVKSELDEHLNGSPQRIKSDYVV